MIFDRLIRIADRLAKVEAGSAAADAAIHEALRLAWPVPLYTTDAAATRTLLPAGFEWMPTTHSGGWVYAPCRRSGLDGEWHYPHHGQFGRTLPLSMCGGVMRAWAMLAKG
ncbi:hypothetical protein [Belnapia moabensis]|uniref:hypothetical protein n=1 Tax=Belnapia moabensis TaxID=365533 RepID=UPI001470011C|nr:hypothetical protein [Belnapia moabensis]